MKNFNARYVMKNNPKTGEKYTVTECTYEDEDGHKISANLPGHVHMGMVQARIRSLRSNSNV